MIVILSDVNGSEDQIIMDVKNIVKQFGGLRALDGASIQIKSNKINLLIGANGSGKTTLINTLSGLYEADQGTIHFMGEDITKDPIHHRYDKGLVRTFQSPRLFRSLTVLENLLLANHSIGESFRSTLLRHKWQSQEEEMIRKARDVLEYLEIPHLENSLAYDLSGGQIKLLELAKTLLSNGSLVLLDEPIGGIAPKLAHKLFEKIRDASNSQKTTFLIIEHRLDIALQYADHVFVMSDGRIIADDLPDKILSNPKVVESYIR